MKKRNIKNLSLNKKTISNFELNKVKGGTFGLLCITASLVLGCVTNDDCEGGKGSIP